MSSSAPPSHPVTLTTPPLHLRDKPHSLSLTFSATLTLLRAPGTPSWRHSPLLRAPGFHLAPTIHYNNTAVLGSTALGSAFARLLTSAPMWQQLDLSPALSIRAEEIHISLSRRSGSSVETTLLPGLLPCAHLTRIALAFEFCGVDDLDKGLEALVPLVDVALRSFWGDKIAKLAPILGKVGFLRGLEDREGYVRLVAGALERFCPEEQEEVEGRVWRVVLENLRDGEALEGLDSRVHRAEAPDYGGSSDGFLLGGAEYDSGDECLFGDDYDDDYDREILWDDWDDGPEFPGLLMDNLSDGGDELWESLDNDGGTRGDTKVDSYIWDENELLLDSE